MYLSSLITLERTVSFERRQKIIVLFSLILLCGAAGMCGLLKLPTNISAGIFFIALSVLLKLKLLDFFFLSTTLRTTSFLASYASESLDPLRTIFSYPIGQRIIARLGLPETDRRALLVLPHTSMRINGRDLGEVVRKIFETDVDVAAFFETRGVTEDMLILATSWAEREFVDDIRRRVPLGKKRVGAGLGEGLAFGGAYFSRRFGISFGSLGVTFESENHEVELRNLISILNKTRESNAVLIGDDKLSLFSILYTLEHMSGREVLIFDGPGFIAAFGNKQSFENSFLKLLAEVSRAGNLVFVMPDLAEFIDNARTIGSDALALIDPFLASAHLQVIATASRASYERRFEHEPALLSRFEKVDIKEETSSSIERFAELRARDLEKKEKVFFTAGALLAVRDSILRFSPELVIDATDDIIRESIARAKGKGQKMVTASIVLEGLEARTGVPQTTLSADEKTKLSTLETLLGTRVIGQDDALHALASALRRARAGVSSDKRPMGSFLFLGPTGVGKTETTKALSDIFFTNIPLVRFDMSEYNSTNSLSRLIGTLTEGGTLSAALREHEYGVLLLDEFEKTDKAVLDLFLQVLDEGFFSDGQGKRVDLKNHIIIATSNAGSDLIFNLVKAGKDLGAEKESIISSLVDHALFKPELLNRFDGIILFHPLSSENLRKIAGLLLTSLDGRLRKKGITLNINDTLLDFLVQKGQDPKFGARPLNRAIQDTVESVIAKSLLDGTVKAGDTVTLNAADLV